MHPPVVEHLRHMGRAAHLLNEPEEKVVVLTAITFGAFPAHLLEQLPPEHGQMADVVAAEQVIRGVIGLEVGHQRLFDLFGKEGLVAVQEAVRLPCLTQLPDRLTHGVHGVGRKDVIVVGQRQIFPRCQFSGGVGVGRNALVFDFFVYDVLIFCLIFPYDIPHTAVGGIRGIRQAELTIGGSLVHEGIQKLPQKHLRSIIQRCQHGNRRKLAVFKIFSCHFGSLGFQHLFAGR